MTFRIGTFLLFRALVGINSGISIPTASAYASISSTTKGSQVNFTVAFRQAISPGCNTLSLVPSFHSHPTPSAGALCYLATHWQAWCNWGCIPLDTEPSSLITETNSLLTRLVFVLISMEFYSASRSLEHTIASMSKVSTFRVPAGSNAIFFHIFY